MKTIPSYIWDIHKPDNLAEDKLLQLLSQLELGEKSIAFHSLNLRGDRKQSWYEIDFLIITQFCVYGIEAKTGFLSSGNGEWHIHKSNGEIAYSKRKSPYIQAKDATLHWRDSWMSKKFPELARKLDFVFIAALYMNDEESLHELNCPELPREVVLGQANFSLDGLKKCIESARKYHQTRSNHSGGISKDDVEHIAAKLRPTVEKSYPTGLRNFLLQSQHELTEEQYRLVDALDCFDRLIIDGGAGTGKTFVLAHLIRKDVAQGRRILVLIKPRLLREKIQTMLSEINVFVIGPEDLSLDIERKFDTLYVDEGQDLCDETILLTLDLVLEQGAENSRWRWFGDFQNQRGTDVTFSQEVFDLLKSMTGNNAVYPLKRNVRNTPSVVKWLENICQARMGETVMKGAGPEVTVESEENIVAILDAITQNPVLEDSPDASVITIFPEKYENTFRTSLVGDASTSRNIPCWGSEAFKGLESEVVLVWVPPNMNDEELKNYLYKSVSRARAICTLFTNDKRGLLKQLSKFIRLKT
ncbi:NERD domain-containing protein [Alkalimonas delamerensis]|uniref:NERD domain-containing protein n=1 Tax=Alkalimonas delamerensis TaxID=265981 RepID=A0ABT9GKD4_9GAMM|nr:NERD domain-containing protein [Alkalimonas delamerensis]MDP4527431.1 NERD domain-containing protein [Alkalimonas delamerensis]